MAATQIQKRLWEGKIPVIIAFDREEFAIPDEILYLLLARRMSYFPVYFDQIKRYLNKKLASEGDSETEGWWLEFENVPLKWNWPIGLLYDLLVGLDPSKVSDQQPWRLVLHCKNYPKKHLLEYTGIDVFQDYLLHQMKESAVVRDSNASAIMKLSKNDSIALMNAQLTHNMESYWLLMNRIISNSVKLVPVKVYLPSSNKVIQLCLKPYLGDAEDSVNGSVPCTVGDSLHGALPKLFLSASRCVLTVPILHGVDLALDTPLLALYKEAMYVDGFLHIALIMMS